MIKIYTVIVIYNKFLKDSTSLNYVINKKNQTEIFIVDNSTKDDFLISNKKSANLLNIHYYQFKYNAGLSKAYNYVIKKIIINNESYLLLLDDDTLLPNNYINKLYENIKKNKDIDIFIPIVYSNKSIISPSNILFDCKVQQLNSIEDLNINKVTAINSGLLIKSSIFLDYNYDEKIFLDYVDHNFFRDMRKSRKHILVMRDNVIYQNYSRHNLSSFKSVLFRYKIYIKDFKQYTNKNSIAKIYYYINVIKLLIFYTFFFKKLSFLIEFIKTSRNSS